MAIFNFFTPMPNILGFATLKPDLSSQDPNNPVNVHLPAQRVAITRDEDADPTMPGAWNYVPVPPAKLGAGVVDEGTWPRLVIYDGECIMMNRDEWDKLKLSANWECTIPSVGLPTARLRPLDGPAPRASPYANKHFYTAPPKAEFMGRSSSASYMSVDGASFLNQRSFASAMSIDTVRAPGNAGRSSFTSAMSIDTVRPTREDSQFTTMMSIDTVRTARRAGGSQFTSYMSVDTVAPADRMSVDTDDMFSFVAGGMYSVAEEDEGDESDAGSDTTVKGHASTSTATGGTDRKKRNLKRTKSAASTQKAAGQARPLHRQHREKERSPAPKRHRGTDKHPAQKKKIRNQRRSGYGFRPVSARLQRQRERAAYHQRRRELAQEALMMELMAEHARYTEHQVELARLRAELEEMDRLEREARKREEERLEAVRAQVAQRGTRRLMNPYYGLMEWKRRCDILMFKMRAKGGKAPLIEIDDIAAPVLLKAPYSLKLVTDEEVKFFFDSVKPYVDPNDGEMMSFFKKLRLQMHPDKWGGRQYTAPEGCEDEDRDMVVKVMNTVMQWINPNMDAWLEEIGTGKLYRGRPVY